MENLEKKNPAREALKEIAGKWQEDLDNSVDEAFLKKETTLSDLAQIIFEKGVLDRIAPLDEQVMAARKDLGKSVWEKGRNDPELYLRLIYSVEGVKQAIKGNLSIFGGCLLGGVLPACFKVAYSERAKDSFAGSKKSGEEKIDPFLIMIDEIRKIAEKELVKNNGKVPEKLVPLGTKAEFHGIPGRTSKYYTDDGRISFEAGTYEGHCALYEFLDHGAISPSAITPENFKIIKDEKEN